MDLHVVFYRSSRCSIAKSYLIIAICFCTLTAASCNSVPACTETCNSSSCPKSAELEEICEGGTVNDQCFCCKQCAKIEGEICGGRYSELGVCGRRLACAEIRDRLPFPRILDDRYKENNAAGKCVRKSEIYI